MILPLLPSPLFYLLPLSFFSFFFLVCSPNSPTKQKQKQNQNTKNNYSLNFFLFLKHTHSQSLEQPPQTTPNEETHFIQIWKLYIYTKNAATPSFLSSFSHRRSWGPKTHKIPRSFFFSHSPSFIDIT